MFGSRRRATTTVDVWPGYVDALSALLMLVIFMVLIFTLAQVFLSLAVSSKIRVSGSGAEASEWRSETALTAKAGYGTSSGGDLSLTMGPAGTKTSFTSALTSPAWARTPAL